MITFIASYINLIILFAVFAGAVIAVYLFRKSRSIPAMMRETLFDTAKQWNLVGLAKQETDERRILEGLRTYVETADKEKRAELRGFIRGGDSHPDLNLSKVNAFRLLARNLTEVFPLLGILGTVCSLSVAVGVSGASEAPSAEILGVVLGLFGTAIDSTVYGLLSAVVAMLVFGAIEGRLETAFDVVKRYREIIDKAVILTSGRED